VARETATDLEILHRLAPPAGRDVVDIGCGGGALVRALAAAGARPTGIEISPEQLAPALAADPDGAGRYLVGRAERLPLPDDSMDVAVFMRTLHHVPPAALVPALREAARVVRADGLIYVAEPLPEGDYYVLSSLVEDELEVRRAAQRALDEASAAGLRRAETVEYELAIRLGDPDAFRRRTVSVDPDRAGVFEARRDEIAAAFARLGAPCDGGGRVFLQPMRADVLRRAASPLS
jgi:SAM-dependent methyltransferase